MEVATVRIRQEEVTYIWMRNARMVRMVRDARMVPTNLCTKILTVSVAKLADTHQEPFQCFIGATA